MKPLQGLRRTPIALATLALVMLMMSLAPPHSNAGARPIERGTTLSLDLRLDLGVIATSLRLSL